MTLSVINLSAIKALCVSEIVKLSIGYVCILVQAVNLKRLCIRLYIFLLVICILDPR